MAHQQHVKYLLQLGSVQFLHFHHIGKHHQKMVMVCQNERIPNYGQLATHQPQFLIFQLSLLDITVIYALTSLIYSQLKNQDVV